ncbi:50S ribosomal protein L7/L12 [Clonorchis sinensis]|uniref:50S ribosomal protein L7/L12 n=1 Tax=Clonorchis sinensis TaxID=79923 RepID=G7Y9Z5_CLOSI|nr:50S ribosomal protein L7/L12 [Clonorchis sinensis]
MLARCTYRYFLRPVPCLSQVSCGQHQRCCFSSAPRTKQYSAIEPPEIVGSSTEKCYPEHVRRLAEDISRLSLLEVAELSELLQKMLNITSPVGMMSAMAAAPSVSTTPEAVEEPQVATKSSFTVRLLKFDAAKKVPLIKEIKALVPEMNLVQAKKFVESAPGNVKTDVSKDEAEEIKKSLEAVGATVEID